MAKSKRPATATSSPGFDWPRWAPWLIGLMAVLLYSPSLRFDYVFDDDIYLNQNQITRQGLKGLGDVWTKGSAYGFSKENSGTYRPVTLTSFALESSGGRKPFRPGFSHAVNLLLYGLAVALWGVALIAIMGKERWGLVAAAIALFAWHPVHTEVIANVKNREEILVLLFGAVMLWAWWKNEKTPKPVWLGISLVAYLMACLSKENGVTLLVLVPVMSWLFTAKKPGRILSGTLLYAGVLGVYLLMRWLVLDPASDMPVEDPYINNAILAADGLSGQLATAVFILGKYLVRLVWPQTLNYDYSFAEITPVDWTNTGVWLSVAAYLVLGGLAIWGLIQRKKWAWGLVLFGAALSVVSQLFFRIEATMAERFLFLPSLGFCFFGVMAAWELLEKDWRLKRIGTGLLFGMLLAYGVRTSIYLPEWKDNLTLFSYGVKVSPLSFRTHFNLAEVARVQAEQSRDFVNRGELFSLAIDQYHASLAIYPKPANSWYNLGVCHMGLSEPHIAREAFEKALSMDTKQAQAASNLGVIAFGEQDYARAAAYFQQSLEADPSFADGWANLGAARFQLGDRAGAEAALRKAVQLNPNHPNARKNLELMGL